MTPTASVYRALIVGSWAWLSACGAWPTQAESAEPALSPALQAQLEAGEFAPALQAAQANPRPAERDRQLAAISAAQFEARMRAAGVATAGEIRDDRVRTATLNSSAARYLSCIFGAPPHEPRDTSRREANQRGGAVEPDFDSLIELIESTIAPNTWDKIGGPGAIDSFAGGVYVDAVGMLAPVTRTESSGRLTSLRIDASPESPTRPSAPGHSPASRQSRLRMISLSRLERAAQLRLAAGKSLEDEMRYLAGLQRIQYVFAYPDTNDLVIAGPAGAWREVEEDRVVGLDNRSPVVRLEDLVVIFRHMLPADDARFGCSITPTQENLARTKAFLDATSRASLPAGKRDSWLADLRNQLGRQTIDVYGLDPRTRAARVMVEADYRMKLIGMGLEPGVLGVESYLGQLPNKPGAAPPPMDVLRWWFALNYRAVLATSDRQAFEIRGQGVKVLSENELLTAQGERVHTGASDELNARFTQSFTEKFPQLAAKYPIYAELRNLCDLALVAALAREERLTDRVGWSAVWFCSADGYPIQFGVAPREVETVINHRVINRRQIVAGASGGVRVDPRSLVERAAIEIDTYGKLEAEALEGSPGDLPRDRWWWDR